MAEALSICPQAAQTKLSRGQMEIASDRTRARGISDPESRSPIERHSLAIPSFSINSYSVGRLMPSSRAADVILPP